MSDSIKTGELVRERPSSGLPPAASADPAHVPTLLNRAGDRGETTGMPGCPRRLSPGLQEPRQGKPPGVIIPDDECLPHLLVNRPPCARHTSTTRPDRPSPPAGVESPAQGEGEDMSLSDAIQAEEPGWLSTLDD